MKINIGKAKVRETNGKFYIKVKIKGASGEQTIKALEKTLESIRKVNDKYKKKTKKTAKKTTGKVGRPKKSESKTNKKGKK